MGIVDDTEMCLCMLAGRSKTVCSGVFLVTGDFYIVPSFIADAVGAYPVVVLCGRLKPRQSDLNNLVADLGNAISSAYDFACVGEILILAYIFLWFIFR